MNSIKKKCHLKMDINLWTVDKSQRSNLKFKLLLCDLSTVHKFVSIFRWQHLSSSWWNSCFKRIIEYGTSNFLLLSGQHSTSKKNRVGHTTQVGWVRNGKWWVTRVHDWLGLIGSIIYPSRHCRHSLIMGIYLTNFQFATW